MPFESPVLFLTTGSSCVKRNERYRYNSIIGSRNIRRSRKIIRAKTSVFELILMRSSSICPRHGSRAISV
ncbi:hypothetical protein GcM3_080025 [Golovinomyces cichoracearum]|uniref:Uncharacterized protein n=1 Tax=Golovinomyces cichoracearum TaxID=62708 RepID=A0A420INK4_9PEZI|nr:hypothetical protein GcM3_080025 [Golovinomyces cichoracearum]